MTDSRRWFLLAGFIVMTGLMYLLSPVLTPFVISLLLAYMGDPLVDRFERKMPRSIAVVIVFVSLSLLLLALIFILVPMIERQLSSFVQSIPRYLDWFQLKVFPLFVEYFGIAQSDLNLDEIKAVIKEQWTQAGGIAAQFVATMSKSSLAILGWAANIVLIPVLTFYLLRDWDILVKRVHELIPRRYEPVIVKLVTQSDEVLGAFLRGQLLVMFALGTIYSVGLWMVGLDFSLLIGMLAGLLSFVPYLGFIVGITVASIAAMVQFQDVMQLLPLLLVFGVGQLVESFLLTPLLVGDKIGLHPVAVIFAVIAGGQLFGFFGILLALPVAAIIMVLLRHAHGRYLDSHLYSK